MAFPTSLPSYTTPTSGETLAAAGHTNLHVTEEADIIGVATKIGTGASTPTSGMFLRGNGVGTSAWSQVTLSGADVTGVLPVGNGGTGQNNLTGLTMPSAVLSNPTISGTVSGSATYTTPTITNFSNATHNHSNAAGGGTLNAANALQAGSVNFANLLSTIFSGQVTTYTNPGTAGGTNSFFYVNLGGIKVFWGATAQQVSFGGPGYSVTYPAGFFSTVQSVSAIAFSLVADGGQAIDSGDGSWGTTTLNLTFFSPVNSAGAKCAASIIVIGT